LNILRGYNGLISIFLKCTPIKSKALYSWRTHTNIRFILLIDLARWSSWK
jgi:hypothetical protein